MDKLFTKEDLKKAFNVFRMKGFPHNAPTFESWFSETFPHLKEKGIEPEKCDHPKEKVIDLFRRNFCRECNKFIK